MREGSISPDVVEPSKRSKSLGDALWGLRADYGVAGRSSPEIVNLIDGARMHLTRFLESDPDISYDTILEPNEWEAINDIIAGWRPATEPKAAAYEIYEYLKNIRH